MIWQCIPRPLKAQAQENFSLAVVSRSSLHSNSVMCSPLTLIHAHQAKQVHRPWQKHTGSSIKPPGIDQLAMRGYSVAVRQTQMREVLGLAWPWDSVFFDLLLAALTQKHECERLLMSECAKVRLWPRAAENSLFLSDRFRCVAIKSGTVCKV
jgi:hypothetical protein